ncbi:MAG: selenide, water dikinase SelD [Planctomycetota bacterium]
MTGFVDPGKIQTNSGAQQGDLLVVTKPLGMGAISTGIARARISSEVAQDAMVCMATLNRGAMEVAVEVGVDAMTDVGGYGIAEHANEMAEAAGLTVELELKRMPLFEQALELVRTGMHSNAFRNTRAYLGSRPRARRGVDSRLVTLALDAETSGGLLLAVDKGKVDALCDGLKARGAPAAAIVGRFVARRSCPVVLV